MCNYVDYILWRRYQSVTELLKCMSLSKRTCTHAHTHTRTLARTHARSGQKNNVNLGASSAYVNVISATFVFIILNKFI